MSQPTTPGRRSAAWPMGRPWFASRSTRDGSLANVAIVAHADSKVLDEAALKIVEKASSHFPPVPDSLMKEQVSYVVPIVFKKGH